MKSINCSNRNEGYSTPQENCVIHCLYVKNLRANRNKMRDEISGLRNHVRELRKQVIKQDETITFLSKEKEKRLGI